MQPPEAIGKPQVSNATTTFRQVVEHGASASLRAQFPVPTSRFIVIKLTKVSKMLKFIMRQHTSTLGSSFI
jgi:hypothetical protein